MILSRYAFKVYYDGRGFSGSQRQPGKRTVEGELLKSLEKLKIEVSNFKAAGRTDRGVSALGNVFAFSAGQPLQPRIINSKLPKDIVVWGMKKTSLDFNPRHSKERIYKYFLLDESFNLEDMQKAVKVFKGSKSFHNFSSTDYRSPIRTLNYIDIAAVGNGFIITVSGESFLWQMVRRIITAIKRVGKNEMSFEHLRLLMEPEVKNKIPPSPAENLVLWDVKYGFNFNYESYSKKRLKNFLEKRWENVKIESSKLRELITYFD